MIRNSLVGDCVALSMGFNLVRRNSAISLSSSFSLVEGRKIDVRGMTVFSVNGTAKARAARNKSLVNN